MQSEEVPVTSSCVEPWTVDPEFLTCPVCFQLITGWKNCVECTKCHRLVCMQDYKILCKKQKSGCPYCKDQPWSITKYRHPLYINLFTQVKYHCEHCKDDMTYDRSQLQAHLKSFHNLLPFSKDELNIYCFFDQIGQGFCLSQLQNAYVNYKWKIQEYRYFFKMEDESVLLMDLELPYADRSGFADMNILPEPNTNTIKLRQKYCVWQVQRGHNSKEYQVYGEVMQGVLENGYEQYLKDQINCEMMIDVKKQRVRVSFKDMLQVNTFHDTKLQLHRHQFTFY